MTDSETPETAQPEEDPGYLVQSGEAVGEDGSVVPVIGGLPAVEGSAWDIGAAAGERGGQLAVELGKAPGPALDEDTIRLWLLAGRGIRAGQRSISCCMAAG